LKIKKKTHIFKSVGFLLCEGNGSEVELLFGGFN
tara:strand:- start:1318 stop:1419 length:102 start_codon:yes stop_codon:yes gene_type:complete